MASSSQDLVSTLMVEILDSFEKLEIVLALERAGAARSVSTLASEIKVDSDAVAEALAELIPPSVVERVGQDYRLAASGPWTTHVEALAELQRTDRMRVVTLMSSAALVRMRARANRAFADAFVISKKKGDNSDG